MLTRRLNTIQFSLSQFVRSKASARSYSHSTSSADNDVYGRTDLGLFNTINKLGASKNPRLSVAAFINGVTINCKLRLDMGIS